MPPTWFVVVVVGVLLAGQTVGAQYSVLVSVNDKPHPSQVTANAATPLTFSGKGLSKLFANATCAFSLKTGDNRTRPEQQLTPLTATSDTTCTCPTPGDLAVGTYALRLSFQGNASAPQTMSSQIRVVASHRRDPSACQDCDHGTECRLTSTKRHLAFCCTVDYNATTDAKSTSCVQSTFVAGLAPWEWVVVGISALVFFFVSTVIVVALTRQSCNKSAVRPADYQEIADDTRQLSAARPSIIA